MHGEYSGQFEQEPFIAGASRGSFKLKLEDVALQPPEGDYYRDGDGPKQVYPLDGSTKR